MREYCPSEYFNVSCSKNSVIFMTSSKYGRMSSGRCITAHHGNLGCSKNVLPFMDKKCSGKQKCQVYIAEPELHDTKPCPRDFASYLEASYECVPGNVTCSVKVVLIIMWFILFTKKVYSSLLFLEFENRSTFTFTLYFNIFRLDSLRF